MWGHRIVVKADEPGDADHAGAGVSPSIPIAMDDRSTLRLTLDVTKAGGTNPTLDVTLETSEDAVTWRTLGTFAQKTTVSSERKCFAGCDRYVRAKAAMTGTSLAIRYTIIGDAV